MKIKKYGYALLMILLIVFTIFLSVKHEQKRLSEKMALQEEKASEEMTVQSEKETVNTESAASIWQEKSENEKEDDSIEEAIIENDKYFRIIDAGEQTYPYSIYNADGKEVKSGVSYRIEPGIHYIDQETIEIHISAGTGIFYCVYYDIVNDRFSEWYESPVAAKYHRVAFLNYGGGERSLVVKDMFDEGSCYQEYFPDFAEAVFPVVSAVFTDEDTLLITYMSGEFYEEKTKVLFWGENEKENEAIEEAIIANDKYFRIIDAGEGKYLYTIYNADGKEVKNESCYREAPWIHYIDRENIEIRIGAGLGAFYSVYYDIVNDRFSEQYESPKAAKYHRVAFQIDNNEKKYLIIKDMFDEGNCYQEFPLDFTESVVPIVYAAFTDEDTLILTYRTSDFNEEKTKVLFWGESDEKEIPVCDIVRAMDFTAKEPQLDITPEENRAYLEGYLKVLKNEIPAIGKVEVKYYKDLWRAGIEFELLLKEKDTREYPYLYYYDDLDGDGKPEFAINQGCMVLFKYDKELDQCIILDQEQSCYFESIVGVGQIRCHDGLHANTVRDDLISLVEDGSFQYILRLDEGVTPSHHYYQIGVSEAPTYDEYYVDVSEEEWNEITKPFFEMVENNAVPRKTLEEVFGDLLEENTK